MWYLLKIYSKNANKKTKNYKNFHNKLVVKFIKNTLTKIEQTLKYKDQSNILTKII